MKTGATTKAVLIQEMQKWTQGKSWSWNDMNCWALAVTVANNHAPSKCNLLMSGNELKLWGKVLNLIATVGIEKISSGFKWFYDKCTSK